jgi:hypothetical protein
MYNEFAERTGFCPSQDLYRAIEKAYIMSDMDKDAFCAAYKENRDGLAERIAGDCDLEAFNEKTAEAKATKIARSHKEQEITRLKQRIRELETRLEREMEWQPAPIDSAMKQEDYEKLAGSQGVNPMVDDEAAHLIAKEFGFDRDKVGIVRQLNLHEINRHGGTRIVGSIRRDPVFDAWDWNYIAFSVRGNVTMFYEMVNGGLHLR